MRAVYALVALCAALENTFNENPDCDPRGLVEDRDGAGATVAALRRCTRGRDLALVGNSVTRHVYFSIASVLRAAAGRSDADAGGVLAAGASVRVDHTYRAEEKARCNPFNADHDASAALRGACDEPLPGGGHIFAYWNTTGMLPKNALAFFRARAAESERPATIVVFNTLMDALAEPRTTPLDGLARNVARSLVDTAAGARGWAEVAWVPAPRVCAAAPGWAIKHFGLPPYTGDELNARVARHNAVVARTAASEAPGVLRVGAVRAMDPASTDAPAVAAACACYDDYVHHHRVTFNVISNIVRDLAAAGYCGD